MSPRASGASSSWHRVGARRYHPREAHVSSEVLWDIEPRASWSPPLASSSGTRMSPRRPGGNEHRQLRGALHYHRRGAHVCHRGLLVASSSSHSMGLAAVILEGLTYVPAGFSGIVFVASSRSAPLSSDISDSADSCPRPRAGWAPSRGCCCCPRASTAQWTSTWPGAATDFGRAGSRCPPRNQGRPQPPETREEARRARD